MQIDLEALHTPMTPILRHALAHTRPRPIRVALDVACGAGHKSPLLAEVVVSGGSVLGVDWDRAALHAARAVHPQPPFAWVAGDALALPLGAGCADLVWCVAALGLFVDELSALRELRRVLRPGGMLFLATSEQLWVRVRDWPADLLPPLMTAYARHLAAGGTPAPPADGLGDALTGLLVQAGFTAPNIRTFLLPSAFDPADPIAAELVLADWRVLREALAPLLPTAILQRCDAAAASEPDPELAPVLLVATAS